MTLISSFLSELIVFLHICTPDPYAIIKHIIDFMEIAKHGVFGTPAVVVDGEVKCVGRIPTKEEIIEWIKP